MKRALFSGQAFFRDIRMLLSAVLAGKRVRGCSTLGNSSILGKAEVASLSLCFLICLIRGQPISFQHILFVEIRCCTSFPFLLVRMKCLPLFSPSAILFGLPLSALATGPPVTAVVDLFPPHLTVSCFKSAYGLLLSGRCKSGCLSQALLGRQNRMKFLSGFQGFLFMW